MTNVWKNEEWSYQLQIAGRNAGSARWVFHHERENLVLRTEHHFVLGTAAGQRRTQISKLEANSRLPVQYSENSDGAGRSHFEVRFDRDFGVVTLRQNRDEAQMALTQDYHDPLSLLQALRELDEETTTLRVAMVGGTVLVTRLENQTLQTPWGECETRVYYLRPGVAFVYIEANAPQRIVRLDQSTDGVMLESWLMAFKDLHPDAPAVFDGGRGNNGRSLGRGGRLRNTRLREERDQSRDASRNDPRDASRNGLRNASGNNPRPQQNRNRRDDGNKTSTHRHNNQQTATQPVNQEHEQKAETNAQNPTRRRKRFRRRGAGKPSGGNE